MTDGDLPDRDFTDVIYVRAWAGFVDARLHSRRRLTTDRPLTCFDKQGYRAIQRSLNGRPRKTLGYKMPEEKLAEIVALST